MTCLIRQMPDLKTDIDFGVRRTKNKMTEVFLAYIHGWKREHLMLSDSYQYAYLCILLVTVCHMFVDSLHTEGSQQTCDKHVTNMHVIIILSLQECEDWNFCKHMKRSLCASLLFRLCIMCQHCLEYIHEVMGGETIIMWT